MGDIESLSKRLILIDKGTIIYDGDLQKFNSIFGAYRTLEVEIEGIENGMIDKIGQQMNLVFTSKELIHVAKKETDWLDVTINQDEVKLMDVLNYMMKKFPVKDIKVKEIALESVIRKVYEGELTKYEQVPRNN